MAAPPYGGLSDKEIYTAVSMGGSAGGVPRLPPKGLTCVLWG